MQNTESYRSNGHTKTSLDQSIEQISILLLDAENLKLNINTEIFLASLCNHPLQVKIAFANWRNQSMGKQDVELYQRGYQLIHVPGGKDSADAKMIALGSSILQPYPTVKEVFVCSNDGILIHLCNQLQIQGLTVYWVRRQNHSLKVENLNTSGISYYSLVMETEIPSFEGFVQKIEELIKVEQQSITERLSNLTTITTLFQERCNLVMINDPPLIVQGDDVIASSKAESTQNEIPKENLTSASAREITPTSINSREELEAAIFRIITAMKVRCEQEYVPITKLSIELHKVYGQSARAIVKKLKLGSNFTKFLETCPRFQLNKTDKQYCVALARS